MSDPPAEPSPGSDTPETPPEAAESPSAESASAESAPAEAPVTEPKPEAQPKGKTPRPKPRRPRDPSVMRAFRAGLPIDGTIAGVVKGGYEVRVGKSRGFCPHSQIDLHRIEDAESQIGKSFPFKVIQVRRGGEDVVLSRRALLEDERAEEAKAVRATLLEDAIMDGHVVRLTDFGAFVDLGAGVTGLVHVTEMAHARVGHPSEVVKVGDRVSARILKIDEASGKISLSLRRATPDPWEAAAERLRPGAVLEGTVKRLADFGAFVEIEEGVEALVPARECPPLPGGWRVALTPGTRREFVVLAAEPARRRATLLPKLEDGIGADPESVVPGAKLRGKVQKAEGFGVFVWLAPGRVGLLPRSWSGLPPGTPLESRFRPGQDLEVEVVDVSEGGKRIRLGIEGAPRPEREADRPSAPRAAARPSRETDREPETPTEPPATFGTSLGDALREALKKR